MHGTFGRYLHVDLSSGDIQDYDIPRDWQTRFVGGKGLAARLLLEELPVHVDPLEPENILIFSTGPFQGTSIVGGGRHAVLAVSPKTGWVADSYAGGHFGHELGRSGYDGIVIRGRAPRPVFLVLVDGVASLQLADDCWGQGTSATEEYLTRRFPGARVSSIGIAGENQVVQACIINDRTRAAGRPGFGAVMGSKNLKAVVVRGTSSKTLATAQRLAKERADYARSFASGDFDDFGEYGTAQGLAALSEMGILPTKNFQLGAFAHAEEISGERMHDTILVDRDTCTGCPIRCKRAVRTMFDAQAVTPDFGGPEYETLAAFGSLCLNRDLHAISLANQLCNEYGLDTISTGGAVAFLMEASERRLIDENIPWGDARTVVRLVRDLAQRKGLAGEMAAGMERFAAQIGAEFAMSVKGVELPMHEPRGKQGMGLSYATSPRGATHLEGLHDTMLTSGSTCQELHIERAYDRFTLLEKTEPVVTFEDLRSFDNCLVLCVFTSRSLGEKYSYPKIRSLLEAITGLGLDGPDMLRVGRRAYAAMRVLSGQAGHTMDEDTLPGRFARPLPEGGSAGHPVDSSLLQTAIHDYYRLRGFDRFGPTDDELRRLDMHDVVGRIARGTHDSHR